MTYYSNGKKIRHGPDGHYISVFLRNDQYAFLKSECEKLNMRGSPYMRDLLVKEMEEAKDYLKK